MSSDVYDAYGSDTTTPAGDVWGFGVQAGYYGDGSLLLLTHRYYYSAARRFLTRDSMGCGGGINLYSYTQNNPGNGNDPLGENDSPQVWEGIDPEDTGPVPMEELDDIAWLAYRHQVEAEE